MKQIVLSFIIFFTSFSALTAENTIYIGTIAYRGIEQAHARWGKTIEYIQQEIPQYRFILKPLSLEQLEQQINNNQLDFLLGHASLYYSLKHKGLSPLSSIINRHKNIGYEQFGAVIFSRADRDDITRLEDLKGKRFGAVSKKAFGGFQMAWREFKSQNIDPFKDFKELRFLGIPMDKIVYQVRDGKIDAGTVRTDLLERMQSKGLINIANYKIINPQKHRLFPFKVSTRLYPSWFISKAESTPDEISKQVLQALLKLTPEHPAAKTGRYMGWTSEDRLNQLLTLSLKELSEIDLAEDRFISIDQMMRELEIGPYNASTH